MKALSMHEETRLLPLQQRWSETGFLKAETSFASSVYRLRPYVSCEETQSSDDIAAPSESSPASATPATISANLCTFPLP